MKRALLVTGLILFSLSCFGADPAKGQALSSQCSVCHAKNGVARDPEVPNLAGQSAFYIEKALVDYKKGLRQDRRMSIIAQSLSLDDIKNLAAWYSSFEISVTVPVL